MKRITIIFVFLGGFPVFGQRAFEEPPLQVNVSVKVVEFQTSKGLETGLSAYFRNRNSSQSVNSGDITFPASTSAGINIFLDQLGLSENELNVVLQGLVQENRAFILSHPSAMVGVGREEGTNIRTTQRVPYESTLVIENTPIQVTEFRDTGVMLDVKVPEIIDDDGDWRTTNDTFIKLELDARVREEGQRITIALDDQLVGGLFSQGRSAIEVPEFVDRSITTKIWVRHGQVLVLGGLYRDLQNKNLSNVPWLADTENFILRLASKVIPGNKTFNNPLSSALGNRQKKAERRELVFLIKVESWYAALGPVPRATAATELLSQGPALGSSSIGPEGETTEAPEGGVK